MTQKYSLTFSYFISAYIFSFSYFFLSPHLLASDWEEDNTNKEKTENILKGAVEKSVETKNLSSNPKFKQDATASLLGTVTKEEGLKKGQNLLGPKLEPRSDDEDTTLKGNAKLDSLSGSLLDPDKEDQDLMIEWDRWRNRFLRAIQLGLQEIVNNPDPEEFEPPRIDSKTGTLTSRYPLGTSAAFACQISKDGQIKNLQLIESSGFTKYDKALLKSIKQLEATRILVFPRNSKRNFVSQAGRIKTANSNDFQYHHFGDIERVQK